MPNAAAPDLDSPAAAAAEMLLALARATPAGAAAAASPAAAKGRAGRQRARLAGSAAPYSGCLGADLEAACRWHRLRSVGQGKQVSARR
jgi:hypothetical protein